MKIAIAIVSHDHCPVKFAYSLAKLAAYSARELPEDVEFTINMISGTYVHSGRQELLEAMLSHGVTHILWVDSDMAFPKDALIRLLMHRVDVVGVNYSKRRLPAEFVAFKSIAWDGTKPSVLLETNADSTGLEEVESMGMGMVLIRAQCLKHLPSLDEKPWFFFEWLNGRRQVGEDTWFFRLLRESGVRLFVDQDLSKEILHCGSFEYSCEHAEMAARIDKDILAAEAAEQSMNEEAAVA